MFFLLVARLYLYLRQDLLQDEPEQVLLQEPPDALLGESLELRDELPALLAVLPELPDVLLDSLVL